MPEITRSQLVLYAVALCAIAWLGARYLKGSQAPAAGTPVAVQPRGVQVGSSSAGPVTVHVAGAVRRPGVYRLRGGARALEAVEKAGGATRRADLAGLNLAGRLEDGRQIVVPVRARAVGAVPDVPGTSAVAQPVDLNRATLEQLDTLDGVGPATARKILDYREANGGFGSVEELGQVSGIGEKRMAALREKVRV